MISAIISVVSLVVISITCIAAYKYAEDKFNSKLHNVVDKVNETQYADYKKIIDLTNNTNDIRKSYLSKAEARKNIVSQQLDIVTGESSDFIINSQNNRVIMNANGAGIDINGPDGNNMRIDNKSGNIDVRGKLNAQSMSINNKYTVSNDNEWLKFFDTENKGGIATGNISSRDTATLNNATVNKASINEATISDLKTTQGIQVTGTTPGALIERNYGTSDNRYGVGQFDSNQTKLYTSSKNQGDISLSRALDSGKFDDILTVKADRSTNIYGNLNTQNLNTKTGVKVTNNDPGALIEKNYGSADNRYGLGQFAKGETKVYTASKYPGNVSLSIAKKDGTFDDILTVKSDRSTKISGAMNANQINATSFKSVGINDKNWLEINKKDGSLLFGADVNNRGISSEGKRDFNIYMNNSAKLTLSNDGSVNIPGKLHASSITTDTWGAPARNYLSTDNSDGTNWFTIQRADGNIKFGTDGKKIRGIESDGTKNFGIYTTGSNPVMSITQDQRVGIMTETPRDTLDVNGNALFGKYNPTLIGDMGVKLRSDSTNTYYSILNKNGELGIYNTSGSNEISPQNAQRLFSIDKAGAINTVTGQLATQDWVVNSSATKSWVNSNYTPQWSNIAGKPDLTDPTFNNVKAFKISADLINSTGAMRKQGHDVATEVWVNNRLIDPVFNTVNATTLQEAGQPVATKAWVTNELKTSAAAVISAPIGTATQSWVNASSMPQWSNIASKPNLTDPTFNTANVTTKLNANAITATSIQEAGQPIATKAWVTNELKTIAPTATNTATTITGTATQTWVNASSTPQWNNIAGKPNLTDPTFNTANVTTKLNANAISATSMQQAGQPVATQEWVTNTFKSTAATAPIGTATQTWVNASSTPQWNNVAGKPNLTDPTFNTANVTTKLNATSIQEAGQPVATQAWVTNAIKTAAPAAPAVATLPPGTATQSWVNASSTPQWNNIANKPALANPSVNSTNGNLNVTNPYTRNSIQFTNVWSGTPDNTTNVSEISNDTGEFKQLMIVGNKSAGGARTVGVWDKLNVNGDLNVTGNLVTKTGIQVTNNDPGVLIEKNYGATNNRYGIGQYPMGQVKVYTASSFPETNISLSKTNLNGTFDDMLTVKKDGANVNQLCLGTVCINQNQLQALKNKNNL